MKTLNHKFGLTVSALLIAGTCWFVGSAKASDCIPGPDKNLASCDFSFSDLADADLSYSDLSNANFESADLTNSKLRGANLSGTIFTLANLTNVSSGEIAGIPTSLPSNWKILDGYLLGPTANLSEAELTDVDITGINIQNANMSKLKSRGLTGTPLFLPQNWRLNGGFLIGPSANLAGANLKSLLLQWHNFSNANLDGADLSFSSLYGVNFSNASLKGANLTSATVTWTNFSNANLESANLSKIYTAGSTNFSDTNLSGVKSGGVTFASSPSNLGLPQGWTIVKGFIVGPTADLTDADLSNGILTGIDLSGAKLTNLKATNIFGTPAALPSGWAILRQHLVGPTANLSGAILTYADFSGISLREANLSGANLTSTTFSDADLSQANLSGVVSGNINGTIALLPSNWSFRSGYLLGPSANLTDKTLVGVNLSDLDLRGSIFTRSRIDYSDFSNSDLTGVVFSGGSLTGSIFTEAKIKNAELIGLNLTGADFSNSDLSGIKSSNVYGDPILSQGWMIRAGRLVGPGANLSGAFLKGTNLAGVNLEGTDLSDSILEEVSSGSISGNPLSLPDNWTLQNGYLIGPGANLTNADLSYTDLRFIGSGISQTVISGANFTGANLSGLDLRNRDLRGVTLTNANLTGLICYSCDLRGVSIAGADIGDSRLFMSNFTGANATGTNFNRANLDSADLSNIVISGADFSEAVLTRLVSGGISGQVARLPEGWRLTEGFLVGPGANLNNKDLGSANLTGLDLHDVSLNASNLSQTTLAYVVSGGITGTPSALPPGWKLSRGLLLGSSANLSNETLTGVSLSNVDLSQANLSGVTSGSIVGAPIALPDGWRLTRGYLVGPTANLTNAQLASANFANVDLSHATLTGVASGSISGSPRGLPTGWMFSKGHLIGPTANLVNADLSGLDLQGLDLGRANLTGANLTGVSSGQLAGCPSELPVGWGCFGGYLVGPQANLRGAKLDNLYVSYVNLEGADFSEASLNGIRATEIDGEPKALPDGWRKVSHVLIGPGAKLFDVWLLDADLSGLDLTGVDLSDANLSGSNLSFANLTDSDLSGAELTGVNLTSANLYNAFMHRARFLNANLTDVRAKETYFGEANFNLALLIRTEISDAYFTSANLEFAVTESLIGAPVEIPSGWVISGGKFVKKLTLLPTQVVMNTIVGKTAYVSLGTFDEGVVPSIQWYLDKNPIIGANSSSLSISPNYLGRSISAKVTVTKKGYETITLESQQSVVAAGVLRAFSVKISGVIQSSKIVTAVCSGTTLKAQLSYQWLLDGKVIKGATKSKFTIPSKSYKGRKLSVVVTQSMSGYIPIIKTSVSSKVG